MPVLLPGMMQQCQRLKLSVKAIRNLISVCMATLFEKVQKLGLSIKDWEIVLLLVYRGISVTNSGLGKSNRTLI